ncbi:MAG: ATP-binding cassette domain-containing protein, partial [Actinomycetota bacterium]|nr:ATP-binding cassette domain-containing protein [Actinomycetota bacterium]
SEVAVVTEPALDVPAGTGLDPDAMSVVARGLTKVFANGHRAVAGVSLVARPGEVVGVVGPNGAGKSTILRMLATLLQPSAGSARICGHALSETRAVRQRIGVALQDAGLDPLMTAREHFGVQSALYQLPRDEARARADALLTQFGLTTFADKTVGSFSGGTARRLDLALALLHQPPVLLFDEPTVGLDPRSRRDVWTMVREWAGAGRVVIFSTQYLEEADILCDRVYIIDHGAVVVEGTPQSLKAQVVGGAKIRLQLAMAPEEAIGRLSAHLPATGFSVHDGAVVIAFDSDQQAVAAVSEVVAAAGAAGVGLRSLSMSAPTLEDVFLQFTGSTLEPEPLTGKGMDMTARVNRGIGGRGKKA